MLLDRRANLSKGSNTSIRCGISFWEFCQFENQNFALWMPPGGLEMRKKRTQIVNDRVPIHWGGLRVRNRTNRWNLWTPKTLCTIVLKPWLWLLRWVLWQPLVALVKLKGSGMVQATGCRFSVIFGLGNDFCEPIRIAWVQMYVASKVHFEKCFVTQFCKTCDCNFLLRNLMWYPVLKRGECVITNVFGEK